MGESCGGAVDSAMGDSAGEPATRVLAEHIS